MSQATIFTEPFDSPGPEWVNPFEVLRKKWSTVPGGGPRRSTEELLRLSDRQLLDIWKRDRIADTIGAGFDVRGWYHTLYKDILPGQRVMDVGAGLGMDALTFAQHGAKVTLVDITESNHELQQRLAKLLDLDNVDFLYLESLDSLDKLDTGYDVIWCQGSMINAPFDAMQRECAKLLEHLRIGGRWIELAYPRQRWVREGAMPFSKWGVKTDGPGTPWMEFYDLPRLLGRLFPAEFDVVLSFNFHNDDFNWFDLQRRK